MEKIAKQIFIGGTGRSGTSICYKFLSKHKEIFAFNQELRFVVDYKGLLSLVDALSRNFSTAYAREALWNFEKMMRYDFVSPQRPPFIGIDFVRIFGKDHYFSVLNRFIDKIVDSEWIGTDYQVEYEYFNKNKVPPLPIWPKRIMKDVNFFQDRRVIANIVGEFVDDLFGGVARNRGKIHWCEKTPHNILHIDFLYKILPDHYFIHMIRDPRGVAQSFENQFWASSKLEDTCLVLKNIYKRYFFLKNKMGIDDYRYLELKLEDCAVDNGYLRYELCRFLGVDDLFLNPPVLNIEKVDYWKSEMKPSKRRIVEKILGEEISALGYSM
jgi:hypothetical protein